MTMFKHKTKIYPKKINSNFMPIVFLFYWLGVISLGKKKIYHNVIVEQTMTAVKTELSKGSSLFPLILS